MNRSASAAVIAYYEVRIMLVKPEPIPSTDTAQAINFSSYMGYFCQLPDDSLQLRKMHLFWIEEELYDFFGYRSKAEAAIHDIETFARIMEISLNR